MLLTWTLYHRSHDLSIIFVHISEFLSPIYKFLYKFLPIRPQTKDKCLLYIYLSSVHTNLSHNFYLKSHRKEETMEFSQNLKDNITHLHEKLNVQTNFDVVYRIVHIGGREACLYFIDGFTRMNPS